MTRRAATRAELYELDRRAIQEFGIPSATLMENAGRAVAGEIRKLPPAPVTVFAGKGNNGGDGLVVARLLSAERRVVVHRVESDDDLSVAPGIVVDAIFGIGLAREVEGRWRAAIEAINASRRFVVAVDIPSGLDCDTGRPLGVAVRANLTVTFGLAKVGFANAAEYTGAVTVAEIGYPEELLRAFEIREE